VVDPSGEFYNQPVEFALQIYEFYRCSVCASAIFGGRRDCAAALQADGHNAPLKRTCAYCKGVEENVCRFHGDKNMIFKCRFCCSFATWFCGGLCHYCESCHDRAGELTIW
jgi:hypothetical protein